MEGEPALRAISQRRKGDRVEDIEPLRHEEIAEACSACIRLTGGGGVTNSGTKSGIGSPGADGISISRLNDQSIKDLGAVVVNQAEGIVTGERVGLFLSGGGGTVLNDGIISGVNGVTVNGR